MSPQRTRRHTPRHSAGAPVPAPVVPVRRRGGPFARHLRSAPRVAVTSGVVAAVLLGPPLGLTLATATGEVRPEHAGPFGPVVAAMPWQGGDPGAWIAERLSLGASRTLAGEGRDGVEPAGATGDPDGAHGADGGAQDGDAGTGTALPPAGTAADAAAPPPGGSPDAAVPSTGDTPEDGAGGSSADGGGDPASSDADADAGTGTETGTGTGTTPGAQAPMNGLAAAPPAGPGTVTAEGAAVVEATNSERAAAGCAPLTVDERLTAAAQLHSEDMLAQDYFDHTNLDGRSPWDRAEAQGYPSPGAENIAKGQATAADVVRAWMDSPGHRANILDCDLREIGVGHADRVWTQLFGWG